MAILVCSESINYNDAYHIEVKIRRNNIYSIDMHHGIDPCHRTDTSFAASHCGETSDNKILGVQSSLTV